MRISRTVRIATIAVVAATSLVLSACSGTPASEGSGSNAPATLRLAQSAPPSNLQIGNYSGGDATLFLSVYDTLVHRGVDGSLEPGLAESWEYNADRTELTLKIRQGSTFSSGTPVDAAAVVASLEAARVGSSAAQNLASIQALAAPDANTVVITLSAPDAALVPNFSATMGAIGDPAQLTSEDSKLWPVGSGPYLLAKEKSTVGTKYVLEKNDEYWDAKDFPYSSVEIQVIQDAAAAQNAVLSGQLDFTGLSSQDAMSQFPKDRFTTGQNQPSSMAALWLVDREGTVVPALADVRVRQAINLAVNRDSIAKNLNPSTNFATNQIFSPNGEAYDKDLLKKTAYDVDAAKKLMTEAGYADGFAVDMPSVQGVTTAYESTIQQALADIGITVTWQSVPFQDFYAKIFGGGYGMFFMFNGLSGTDSQDVNAATSGVFNPFNTVDPEYNQLIAAANASSEEDQGAAYRAVNEFFIEQAWFAPISDVAGYYVTSSSVEYTPPVQYGQGVQPFKPAAE